LQRALNIAVNTRFLIHNKLEGIGRFTFETLKRISQTHPQYRFYCIFDRPPNQEFLFSENIIPIIAKPQARHPILWYWWFEFSVPSILKNINADVFISPDGFALKYNIEAAKIDVVYNGANPSCKPLGEDEKQKVKQHYSKGCNYFVFISAVHPRKNLGRILQAFDLFKNKTQSTTKLIVAGRMAWKNEELKNVYEKMQHQQEVIFVGHLPMKEVERLIASATALCYASLFEGFGLPILEAMYAETPVITSNVSSMPEVAGNAALLVNPKDINSIGAAFIQLENQPELRVKLVEAGKQQRQKFTWEKAAEFLWESVEKTLR